MAFATTDLKHVDQHFGSAERFAIYRVEPHHVSLLKVTEFGQLARDGNESKLLEKFALLADCVAVYCQAVGPSAVRQLMGMKIVPLKVPEGTGIAALVTALQKEMLAGTGWAARALVHQRRDANRFGEMALDGWED